MRGRSHARMAGRKKLPPIPERSLSSKGLRTGSTSVGSGDAGGRRGRDRGRDPDRSSSVPKVQRKRHGRAAGVPPSPESRRGVPRSVSVESRDDEGIFAELSPASAGVINAESAEENLVPPSPPSPEAASVPEVTATVGGEATHDVSTTPRARDEPKKTSKSRKPDPPIVSKGDSTPVVTNTRARSIRSTSNLKPPPLPSIASHGDTKPKPKVRETQSKRQGISMDTLADGATPFTSNVSRKHFESVVGTISDDNKNHGNSRAGPHAKAAKKYAPEPSWKDLERVAKDEDNANEPPEISSIPTDEIMDSFMRDPTGTRARPKRGATISDDSSNLSDEMESSRETRDQYQLDRLQARIDRRQQMQRQPTYGEEDGPDSYKTLRSSRIKTVRNLYSNRDPNKRAQSDKSIANQTSSTVPSLRPGHTIGHSLTSSVSGMGTGAQSVSHHSNAQQSSTESQELSEYRGKLYAKMLHLLNDLSPAEDGQEDVASVVKDRIMDESRASCCSVAELKLIQRMTEEEMSRILYEFEVNNSLVEMKDTVECDTMPNSGPTNAKEDDGKKQQVKPHVVEENITKEVIGHMPPKRIVYQHHDSTLSVVSGFSDVTSPTCHDGFELDEIIPVRSQLSRSAVPPHLPASPRSGVHQPSPYSPPRKKLPPLSPVLAAVAPNGSLLNNHMNTTPLPSVLEIPEMIDLNEDSNIPGGEKGGESDGAKISTTQPNNDAGRTVLDTIESPKGTHVTAPASFKQHNYQSFDKAEVGKKAMEAARRMREDTQSAVKARDSVWRAIEEDHFHDDIMSAVDKASTVGTQREEQELDEVTSILSQYEEADKKLKEMDMLLEELRKREGENDIVEVSLTDEMIPPKRVTFFEPEQSQPICGCTIQ